MVITNVLAVATSVLVMGAWFALPGSARPKAPAVAREDQAEWETAA